MPGAYINLFESGLYINDCQLVVSGFTLEETTAKKPLFSELTLQPVAEAAQKKLSFKELLESQTETVAQLDLLEEHLKERVAEIIKTQAAKISASAEFKSLGLDSLMTIQLGKNLSKSLDMNLAVTAFWTYPTIRQFASFLQGKIELSQRQHLPVEEKKEESEVRPAVSQPVEMTISIEAEVKQLSFEEVNNQLDEELRNLMID